MAVKNKAKELSDNILKLRTALKKVLSDSGVGNKEILAQLSSHSTRTVSIFIGTTSPYIELTEKDKLPLMKEATLAAAKEKITDQKTLAQLEQGLGLLVKWTESFIDERKAEEEKSSTELLEEPIPSEVRQIKVSKTHNPTDKIDRKITELRQELLDTLGLGGKDTADGRRFIVTLLEIKDGTAIPHADLKEILNIKSSDTPNLNRDVMLGYGTEIVNFLSREKDAGKKTRATKERFSQAIKAFGENFTELVETFEKRNKLTEKNEPSK